MCHWCPSSCCPGAGAQREWVCISSKSVLGPLRGDAWESCSFFLYPKPHWFLHTEVMGTHLGLEPWAGVGLGFLAPEVSLPIFIHHMWVWDCPFCISESLCVSMSLSPPTCLDECDFFNSLVAGLPHSLIFWWFWVTIVLQFSCNFCCGCARRRAVFTYASILTGSLFT